jgi:hypothetical protein
MDSTKEDLDLDLDLKELLDKLTVDGGYESASTSSADVSTNDLCYDSSPYIYNNASDTITLSGSGLTNGGSTILNPGGLTGSYGQVYTISSGLGGAGSNTSPWATGAGSYTFPSTATSSKIQLDGEGADISVNGWSLIDAIQKIEERLNILTPNPAMEKEWDQLKKLGDRYRKLEKKLKEQSDMWNKLKSMPPPEIY